MKQRSLGLFLSTGLFLSSLLASPGAAAAASSAGFTLETLAPGVHALVRTKLPGLLLDSNVVVIVNDEDVVVVDANLTPTSAEATIAAIRKLTPKPVSILVNTHRHADHTGGNATYRREFPQVQIVASSAMAEDLAKHGEETLKGWIDWAKQLDAELPKALASGTSLGGRPLTPDLRSSYEGDLAAAREIVADAARMEVVTPTATLIGSGARLVLHRHAGGQPRRIVIADFGRGHTRGDLVVWLPAESILAAGDLLVVPVPLVGADQSYVEDWVKTLDRLQELGAAVTVPGHGAVQRDSIASERYRDFLSSVARQTRAAMDRGDAADKALEGLDVESFRQQMAGDDKVLNFLFGVWGKGPSVQAIYRERDESKPAN